MTDKIKPVSPFIKARQAGVPIVAIETADPAATIHKCQSDLNGKHAVTPLLQYDIVRGLQAVSGSKPGQVVLAQAFAENRDYPFAGNPTACLDCAFGKASEKKLQVIPEDGNPDEPIAAILFVIHANRFGEDTGFMQAVWNCRLAFEPRGITLVLLGPAIKLPVELKNDVVLISEPLPDHEELGDILDDISKAANLKPEQIGDRDIVVDTMRGTSAFGARQILAMSVTKDGVDHGQLWERKAKMVQQTPGLSVWRGSESFKDLGGLSNLKQFLTRILTSGNTAVRAVLWCDEAEKQLAGAAGDLSGTSQDQMGVLLSFLQDKQVPVMLIVGHPGCGKSAIAKAAGSVAGAPVIALDLGAMKGSLVGQSEQQIRAALDIAIAVSDGKLIMIMTCNKLNSLPPELRRRCTLGTFFTDLPDSEEREAIWPIWLKHYDLNRKQTWPDDAGFTGAEIRACCDMAFRTGLSLKEASAYIVPIIRSAPEQVEGLRKFASNRFISASKPGVYQYNVEAQAEQVTGRKFQV